LTGSQHSKSLRAIFLFRKEEPWGGGKRNKWKACCISLVTNGSGRQSSADAKGATPQIPKQCLTLTNRLLDIF
jgi:hypothetical protein